MSRIGRGARAQQTVGSSDTYRQDAVTAFSHSRGDVYRHGTDLPVEQSCENRVQPFDKKYFAWWFPQIRIMIHPVPPRQEGRIAIVTTREAGCDGRNGGAHDQSCGRTTLLRTAKSRGPDTPTLVSSEQSDLLVMGARKPGPQGEHEGQR